MLTVLLELDQRLTRQRRRKSTVGVSAKLVEELVTKLSNHISLANLNERTCTVLLNNQLRSQIGIMFGDTDILPGGRAQNFILHFT